MNRVKLVDFVADFDQHFCFGVQAFGFDLDLDLDLDLLKCWQRKQMTNGGWTEGAYCNRRTDGRTDGRVSAPTRRHHSSHCERAVSVRGGNNTIVHSELSCWLPLTTCAGRPVRVASDRFGSEWHEHNKTSGRIPPPWKRRRIRAARHS